MNARLLPLALLLALSAAAAPAGPDEAAFKAFSEKVKLDPAVLERFKKASPQLAALLSDRANWAKWAKAIHARAGIFTCCEVDLIPVEEKRNSFARGGFGTKEGSFIKFNLAMVNREFGSPSRSTASTSSPT